jgi:hypothetical protein
MKATWRQRRARHLQHARSMHALTVVTVSVVVVVNVGIGGRRCARCCLCGAWLMPLLMGASCELHGGHAMLLCEVGDRNRD